jgi:VanZ family protein
MSKNTQAARRVYLLSLFLLVIFYCFVAFFPFKLAPETPGNQHNGAELTAEKVLHFHSPGFAYTESPPSWLNKAIAIADFQLSLEVRASIPQQYGPARIFTLSANHSLRNVTVGQHGSSLIIRVRTQRSTLNGTPEYWIEKVFSKPGWHRIEILINASTLEIHAGDDFLLIELVQDQPFEVWDSSYRLALGNEFSGRRPWLGEIRQAVVRVGGQSFDYLLPGALQIERSYRVAAAKELSFVPFVNRRFTNTSIMDWVINFVGFIPFGWLLGMLRRPGSGILLATLLAATLSATFEAGQLLFLAGRFPAIEDLIMNTLGGFAGAWIAWKYDLSVSRRKGGVH